MSVSNFDVKGRWDILVFVSNLFRKILKNNIYFVIIMYFNKYMDNDVNVI